ncbi:hypothetical protein GCM10010911_01110 [Paenibacillus nasutitermitis]|uniref:Uncharacterized protein n=2 Tax=Paenibacillus nasutitermitis TaxID=1652958 RepID=A0A916YIL8_9BACL|nr:hypothetical protein GCM10010911_01110 [Paenibacillus nasutitermitis]
MLRAAKEQGLSIPKDVSIVGYVSWLTLIIDGKKTDPGKKKEPTANPQAQERIYNKGGSCLYYRQTR